MSRKGKPVSYPWYAPDWLSDPMVRSLSIAQKGLYRELLDLAWMNGGSISPSPALARAAGVTSEEWAELWPAVAPFWHEVKGGRLRNSKLDLVVKGQTEFYAEQARKAKLGAEARWGNARGHLPGMPEPCPSDALPSPSPSPIPTPTRTSPIGEVSASSRRSAAQLKRTDSSAKILQAWSACFQESTGRPYVHQGGKDGKSIQRVLKLAEGSGEGLEGVARRVERLLLDPPDQWYADNPSLQILASRWNELGAGIRIAKTKEDRQRQQSKQLLREGNHVNVRRPGSNGSHPDRQGLLEPHSGADRALGG